MRKLLTVAALAAVSAACQPQATQTTAPGPPRAPVVPPVARAKYTLPSPFTPADTLTQDMRKVLAQYNLAPLWQGLDGPVLEGFFGPDHYRFELVLTQVHRDAQNAALYHIVGKCHYRKNVRRFVGTLTMREVSDYEPPYEFGNEKDAPNQAEGAEVYEQQVRRAHPRQVRAEFRAQEERTNNSGEFVGEATLLFYITAPGRLAYLRSPMRGTDSFTNEGYLLLRGTRRNLTTRQLKQFVVADNVFTAAPDVYKDFDIGDRGGEMNPKYAHLGWSEKWANAEWWADTPQPRLSL
jgi:hypothetical protein